VTNFAVKVDQSPIHLYWLFIVLLARLQHDADSVVNFVNSCVVLINQNDFLGCRKLSDGSLRVSTQLCRCRFYLL